MEVLNLGRDTVYRRLSGKSSFTFEEVARLASMLDFSLDDVVGEQQAQRVSFDLLSDNEADNEMVLLAMLQELHDHFTLHRKSENTRVIITANRPFILFMIGHENLFRFLCYKWTHQRRAIPMDSPFSDMDFSIPLIEMKNKLTGMFADVGNFVIIMDRNILLSMIRYIQYFYRRKLVTDVEMELMKNELLDIVQKLEVLMQKGFTDARNRYDFYLSPLEIESNTAYSYYDGAEESNFWIYPVGPLRISNVHICAMHQEWINSIKRYSVLITDSNEILMSEFIGQQYEYVNNMQKVMY